MAAHKDLAHDFINFLLDADISARNHNTLLSPCLNKAAIPYLDQEVLDMQAKHLNSDIFEQAEYLSDLGEGLALLDEIWSELKAE